MRTNYQKFNVLVTRVFYAPVFLGLTTLLFACTKTPSKEVTNDVQKPNLKVELDAGHSYYGITNNASGQFEVYDPDATSWSTPATSFKPSTALGWSATGSAIFGGGTDFKLRNSTAFSGSTQVAVIVDNSWAGIVAWTGTTTRGTKIWGKYWDTGSPNIHGCELLPNGNMAIASTDTAYGNWVRVYNTSVTSGSNYAQFNLRQAHATLWDPANNVLWTCGDTHVGGTGKGIITALSVGGTRTAPTLTEVAARRDTTPGRYPHDISPYYSDNNKLLVTDANGVYVYNKTTKTFTAVPGAANRTDVKGVANQHDGTGLIETRGNGCCGQTWLTNQVNFYNPSTGALIKTITKSGAEFYKGKLWSSSYQ